MNLSRAKRDREGCRRVVARPSAGGALCGALLVTATTLACVSGGGAPAWIDGESPAAYPKDRFVTALGRGASAAEARSRARVELENVFATRTLEETPSSERMSPTEAGSQREPVPLGGDAAFREGEPEAVLVPLEWSDPERGDFRALAVLERAPECERIRRLAGELESELDALVARPAESTRAGADAPSDTNPLAEVRRSTRALRVGLALDTLASRGRVLGLSCLSPRSIETDALRARARASRAALSFVVRTADIDARSGRRMGPLRQLREQIAGNLTRLGFQVGPAEGATIVPIEAVLRLRRMKRSRGAVEVRWEGEAEIAGDGSPDEPILVARSEGVERHPEPATARLRARWEGERDLARRLDERLAAYMNEGLGREAATLEARNDSREPGH